MPMDTLQAIEAARRVLTAAAPLLWIQLTEKRSVAGVRALPHGIDPNHGAQAEWIFIGDGMAETDETLQRAVLMKRCASPGLRGRHPGRLS